MEKYPGINTQTSPLKMENREPPTRIEYACLTSIDYRSLPVIEFDDPGVDISDPRDPIELVYEYVELPRFVLSGPTAAGEH